MNPKKQFKFKIGADPEFVLTMQGKKVDARQTMQLMLNGKKDFQPETEGYKIGKYGSIGWDGANSTAEVRPAPSKYPKTVTNNLAYMFKKITEHIKICDMSTISEFSPVGGHIHLEIPQGEKWSKEKRNTLHKRLASFYLPILISENKINLNLRIRQGYGSLKDQRIQKHFTHRDGSDGYTCEFRTPSAEWLTTPKLANATMAYLGVVYHESLNNSSRFKKFDDLIIKSDKQGEALQTLAIMEFGLLTKEILKKTKQYIKTFELYPLFKEEIDYIFNTSKVIKDKQKANYNIAEGWGISSTKNIPKKREVLASKKTIQNIASKTDFDVLKRVMNINYNQDTNVALFAETLKDRVAAFNWKLKNNYYIFGIRKGINEIITQNMKGEFLTGAKIIKTTSDKTAIDKLFYKMGDKFGITEHSTNITIDFITGKPKDNRENTIIIGLPYDMRTKENVKPFLTLIWQLEKNQIKIEKPENLTSDSMSTPNQKGKVWTVLSQKSETPQNIVIDTGSHSLDSHQAAIQNELQATT